MLVGHKRNRRRLKPFTQEFISKFWSRVKIGEPDECWEWQHVFNAGGYGQIKWDSSTIPAHRIAYELHYGKELENLGCHTCDNRKCCNPNHIFDGTYMENLLDMVSKGRATFKYLTPEDTKEIREMFATKKYTKASLGRMFGVSSGTVYKIVTAREE